MAVTKGDLYIAEWLAMLNNSQIAVNFTLNTGKIALYTNSLAPNFGSGGDTAYSATNEASGTGYTAGGQVTVGAAINDTTTPGTIAFSTSAQTWVASTTVTSVVCGIYYADYLSPKALIFLTYFGGAFSTTAGVFTITCPTAGWFTMANP